MPAPAAAGSLGSPGSCRAAPSRSARSPPQTSAHRPRNCCHRRRKLQPRFDRTSGAGHVAAPRAPGGLLVAVALVLLAGLEPPERLRRLSLGLRGVTGSAEVPRLAPGSAEAPASCSSSPSEASPTSLRQQDVLGSLGGRPRTFTMHRSWSYSHCPVKRASGRQSRASLGTGGVQAATRPRCSPDSCQKP